MPATSKVELLSVTSKEFAKVQKLLASIESDVAVRKDADDTSIKDVIGHRAHWIDLYLGWYHDGRAGKEVFFPAPGYKWNELKRYNAELRTSQAALSWDDVTNQFEAGHRKLVDFLQTCSETELYGGPMQGANNNWTPGRWAEAAGASHYRSAARYVRARLKEQAAG